MGEMTKSIITDMATRYGMEKAAFEATLMQTIMPSGERPASKEEVASFLIVAKEYDLNPFTKEIYAFPSSRGGIQPIVPIDGWIKIINRHADFDGMEIDDQHTEGEGLTAVTCRMYRKGRSHPVAVTEYMNECKRETPSWKRWPSRMLRHKAVIQAARYAFGFSGIIDPDEAERIIEVESIVPAKAATEQTAEALRGRIANAQAATQEDTSAPKAREEDKGKALDSNKNTDNLSQTNTKESKNDGRKKDTKN